MFITFEGPEGCGKTTQAKKLKTYLEDQGRSVILSFEPGGTIIGKEIRSMLLNKESLMERISELFLFAADRHENVKKRLLPALAAGKIVISDRFSDSTLAYQVGGRGLPEDLVRYVNLVASTGLVPELTFLLDVSPENGLKRAGHKGLADRFESEKLEFHDRVRQYYLAIAGRDTGRIKIIETNERGIAETQKLIRGITDEKLRNQG